MRCSQLFILSLFLIVMTSCCDVKNKKKSDMLDSLIGRDVSFVDSLLVFKEENRPRVFMICFEKGYLYKGIINNRWLALGAHGILLMVVWFIKFRSLNKPSSYLVATEV